MEKPGRYMDRKDSKKTLEGGGLGTPATRAEIIEKLIGSFYVERNGKTLTPTSKGKQLIEMVPDTLKSPELTAAWEKSRNCSYIGNYEGQKILDPVEYYH